MTMNLRHLVFVIFCMSTTFCAKEPASKALSANPASTTAQNLSEEDSVSEKLKTLGDGTLPSNCQLASISTGPVQDFTVDSDTPALIPLGDGQGLSCSFVGSSEVHPLFCAFIDDVNNGLSLNIASAYGYPMPVSTPEGQGQVWVVNLSATLKSGGFSVRCQR